MGVWIETHDIGHWSRNDESHPSWVCGLKLDLLKLYPLLLQVTPFVGVWIETVLRLVNVQTNPVTPFVGVWIETLSVFVEVF